MKAFFVEAMGPKTPPKKKTLNNKGKPLGSGTVSQARKERRKLEHGEPWSGSSSSWWQADDSRNPAGSSWEWSWQSSQDDDVHISWQRDDWQANPAYASWWQHDAIGQVQSSKIELDAAKSKGKAAPITPPWKKADSDDEAQDIPYPWRLLDPDPVGASSSSVVKGEPSSSSSSDNWGSWKAQKVKTRPVSADETVLLDHPVADFGEKAEAEAADIKMLVMPKVMIDWHNTLEVGGEIDTASLKKLLDAGCEVTILSYCYANRAAEVRAHAEALEDYPRLRLVETTEHRTGLAGKVDLCNSWSIDVMFDDAQDICKEAYHDGMHVFPICTQWEKHVWFRKLGHEPYSSFALAVEEFLQTYA